ncbi:MarR family winged helix-turn-helix transcriptional regulator [Peptostreptococcus faecalis]|uniref:MarR family winged helix-turn-helix transcriptional regulator n=1 Tax=Peptostreptococcus faecalis TaxID=2045015 RepID=UPI000C7E2C04|nr:MarR family winged helix-turn-helix transcriptional regulator [Peptostreptococcus faecalis]
MEEKELALLLLENFNIYDNLIKRFASGGMKKVQKLTPKQFFTLQQIKKYDRIELKNLSKELYVSTSSLCILLNKMVELEYVFREEGSLDRRNTFYGITDEGRAVLVEEEERITAIIVENMSGFDEKFKKNLEKSLNILNKTIEKLN